MQALFGPFSRQQTQTPFTPAIPSSALNPLPHHPQLEPEPRIDYAACILSITRNMPYLASLPAEARTILEELLALNVRNKSIADPLSLEKRQLNTTITQKKAEFTSLCQARQIVLPIEESTGSPILFNTINEEAAKHVIHLVAFRKQALVQNCRSGFNLSQLTEREFEQLHAKCAEEMQLISQVTNKFKNLVASAKLPESIQEAYNISIKHSGNDYRPFIITVAYLPLGYSIHDLLYGLGIRNGTYSGEESFILDLAETKKLKEHLNNLNLWADDFTLIVGDLIGNVDSAKNYITLGQKPISEIMRNPIRMSQEVIHELPLYAAMPCLLFNQLSLDLTGHPECDFLKARFIDFFRLEGMLGSNGLPKDFLVDRPYQTVLNVEQVMKICPRLNKLLKFQQLLKNYTGANSLQQALFALNNFGLQNELESMVQYKVSILFQMYRSILGPHTGNLLNHLLQSLSACTTIDTLEGRSLELCEDLLKQSTGPNFKINERPFTPSVEQIKALYNDQRFKTYSGNQQHKNVEMLFTKLRTSTSNHRADAPFMEALSKYPDLAESVAELQREFEHRLNGYHALSNDNLFYGRPMIDEAIAYFENYVAKIVYKDQSKVTQDSIERSLIVLAGRNGADLSNGCTRGFAGRINDILLALTTSVGNDLQDHMMQFRRDCLEAIYHEVPFYRDNPESSMAVTEKSEACKFLGIVESLDQKSFNQLPDRVVHILQHFFIRYNSISIYHKARTFFSDKFWQLNKDNDDDGIYQLLEKLEFGTDHSELDKKYRVNGDPTKKWQYAYFQQDLPQYLVKFLIQEKLLFVKPRQSQEMAFQRENESPCTLSSFLPVDYNSNNRSLSNQEILDRARQAASMEVVEPARRVGQIISSRLPEYQPSTS